tara:strand:- start:9867 stop:10088 length:222 start_codon:yes stop_codon:yes gene_type:complete
MATIHINSSGEEFKDVFVFYEPYFYTQEECKTYVNENLPDIMYKLSKPFPNDMAEKIYCVDNDRASQFMKDHG